METYRQKIEKLDETRFRNLFGVKRTVFYEMLGILETAHAKSAKLNRRPPKLTVLDKLCVTLKYYKEYCSMEHLGFEFGVRKNAISEAVNWVERVLIKDERFHLPKKKELREAEFEVILVDCTEQPVQRPKKNSESGIPARKNGTR